MGTDPFHRLIAIDFSAAAKPTLGANSLWMAISEGDGAVRTRNVATRHELADRLVALCQRPGRTLVVIDVALGWPSGFATSLGLKGRPFEQSPALLAALTLDDCHNVNNRFDVANELNRRAGGPLFWGHPKGRHYSHLSPTTMHRAESFPSTVAARRLLERNVGGVIKSPFQLAGAGAVGGQSIVAQAFLHRLARRLDFSVWPFCGGDAAVVVGECYFSLFPWRQERGITNDQKQVRATVRWLRQEIDEGRDPVSHTLFALASATQRRAICHEEGWLVGWSLREGP